MGEILSLFAEFETNIIPVSDFDIIEQGMRVDYITLDDDNKVQIWADNPDSKYAEEIITNKKEILDEIVKLYS